MEPEPDIRHASPRQRLESLKLSRLRELLKAVLPRNRFYASKYASLSTADGHLAVDSLSAIHDWPFTHKEELVEGAHLLGHPANLTFEPSAYVRFHQTSGTHGRPLPVFDTAEDWQWWLSCWREVLSRGRVGRGDRGLVAASFGPSVGFWSAFESILTTGAMAIPSGSMPTIARLELLRSLRATVLVCTPSYGLHLAEVATERKINLPMLDVRLVIVAGEPGGSTPATRDRLADAFGATVLDHAGATEVGPWGVGDDDGRALQVIEPWFHPEFLSLETGTPASEGETSELVLTTLGRSGCPVVRSRTGDVVRPRWPDPDEPFPWVRLEGGVLGRTDDMVVVRGVNVFPSSIDGIVRSFPEIVEYRLTIGSRGSLDEMELEVEDHLDMPARVRDELRVRLGLRVEVRTVPIGALPRFDGKGRRIVDLRFGRSEEE
ncbi:MAG: phenylacetate--CoA ligase family protein [Planctomycetaceae bacterium]